jgi:hypothetical protein
MVISWRVVFSNKGKTVVTRGKVPAHLQGGLKGRANLIRKDAFDWNTHRVKVIGRDVSLLVMINLLVYRLMI